MQHRTPIAAILSALTALKRGGGGGGGGGGGVMLKNSGDALRAFIGAGFCAVILSLSACASKGAADIPIGGGGNVGDGGDNPDPIPVVGISSSANTAQEGGQVALMITSSINALTGGLAVTISIGVADAAEFTTNPPSVCTNLVCIVDIPEGGNSVILVLIPTSDSTTDPETWTATLDDGSNYNPDAVNNEVAFDIVDTDTLALPAFISPLSPAFTNPETLANLNAYDIPTDLAANLIRNLQSEDINGVTITASRYGDAAAPDVFVQMLEFAALGVWVNDNTPEIGMTDHDFDYAFLGDNGVNPPAMSDGRGDAIYDLEGDATYRGLNFFPDGQLTMHFDLGTFEGNMSASEATFERVNSYGPGANPSGFALISFFFRNGDITADGFEVSDFSIVGRGFFMPLDGITDTELTGRFYNAAGYDPSMAAPTELAGVVETTIGGADELEIGFLGRIQP